MDAAHETHAVAVPVLEANLPAAQSVQDATPTAEYLPAAQFVQLALPAAAKLPAAQLTQSVDAAAPEASTVLPAAQFVHAAEPVADAHLPAGHLVQFSSFRRS